MVVQGSVVGEAGCGFLASAVLVWRGRLLSELWALFGSGDGWVSGIKALWHLLTDDVHQALKGLLYIDVVFGTGLKKLKPWSKHK